MIDGAEMWVVLDVGEQRLNSDGPARDGWMRFSAFYEGETARIGRVELRSGERRAPLGVAWNFREVVPGTHLHVELTADMALKALRRLQ